MTAKPTDSSTPFPRAFGAELAVTRHPENEPPPHAIAFRPEPALLYVNADSVLEAVTERVAAAYDIRLVVCDLSESPISISPARACCTSCTSTLRAAA
jgi:MFS superfamily sulfate permease-like transporter